MNINLSENARIIMEQRYLQRGNQGELIETPEELFTRVAGVVAQGEQKTKNVKYWKKQFYELLTSLRFLPNSPTMVNAGTDKGCLSACFVVSPEDDMNSIMDVAHDAAMIEKWGGGIGFGFSKLRPVNDKIATTHGKACGPIAVMKLYSSVGATLTQGAFRLGAHMGQLRIDHPDIRDFIHCKDNDDTLQNFNISVQITDAFMDAVRSNDDWNLINPRNGEVVETVRAVDLWNEICESAWKTGDPGVVFIDRVWETAPNPQLGKIESSNPCITGDTLVYTGEGLMRIDELVGKTPQLAIDSRENKGEFSYATQVWSSGIKPVYKLVTKEGYNLKLTEDHEVYTARGKVAAKDLVEGDKIHMLNHKGGFGTHGNKELGHVLGWLSGDGHIDGTRAVLSFYGDDHELGEYMSKCVSNLVDGTGERPWRKYVTKMHVTKEGRGMVSSTRLKNVVEQYGLVQHDWHKVPDIVYQGTEEMQRAYLQALFGADGTVAVHPNITVRLNSSYPELLEGVQRLLLNFGIFSRIYLRRSERDVMMPDGKGGKKLYHTMENYEVIISSAHVQTFFDNIGFLHTKKNDRLDKAINNLVKGFMDAKFVSTFTQLIHLGEEEVYDLTEPKTHSFIANGFQIGNCGEEFLENYGNCCLGSINLDAHVKEDSTFDWKQLENTIKTAVRFLDNVIEVNTFPLEKLRDVNLRTRRIGLGVMGFADMLIRLNMSYDSDEALSFTEKLGNFINKTAWNASENLATERGPFPEYKNSALAKTMKPVRNSSVVTIAPTGTISRLADCSSGIEPHFAMAWRSNVLWKDHAGTSVQLIDAPISIKESLKVVLKSDEKVQKMLNLLIKNPGSAYNELRKYGINPDIYRTAMDISPESHVRMQAVWQKWATNSVSKTINLSNDANIEDVRDAYELSYDLKCKAVTVYRDGSKSMQVLETGKTSETKEEITKILEPRPVAVEGITEYVKTGHGNMYINVGFDDENKPFELFTTLGRAGGCDSANLEAIARLASMSLRSGVPAENIIDQLKGITCCPIWDKGTLVKSVPDAMAHVLEHRINPEKFKNVSVDIVNNGIPCPDCDSYLVPQEGCFSCFSCGYSKCE